jgi:O-antigen/teichoic acid export membrane protein
MKKILITGLPFFLGIALFAPVIFKFIFGAEWEQAGRFAQLMVPWLIMNLAVSPVSGVPNILNRQKRSFLINLTGVTASFGVLLLSTVFFSGIQMPLLFFSVSCSLYLFYFTRWIIIISDLKSR